LKIDPKMLQVIEITRAGMPLVRGRSSVQSTPAAPLKSITYRPSIAIVNNTVSCSATTAEAAMAHISRYRRRLAWLQDGEKLIPFSHSELGSGGVFGAFARAKKATEDGRKHYKEGGFGT
jgi:hypothetical protein